MVACVLEDCWTIEATADRFQVDAKTVRKWRDRYLAEGPSGLLDRSSRPHCSPNATRPRLVITGGPSRIRSSQLHRVGPVCSRSPFAEDAGVGWG